VTVGRGDSACHFGIADGALACLAATEELDAAATGVAVGGAGAVPLLLLVVPADGYLDEGRDKEEDSSDDGDGEADSVQAARSTKRRSIGDLVLAVLTSLEALLRVRLAFSKWSVDLARAAGCAVAGQYRNGNKGASEENIKDNGEESEEGLSAEEAGEEDSESSVEDCDTRETLDGFPPGEDLEVAVGEDRKEVGKDAEDDAGAAELYGIEDGLEQLQESASESHCGGGDGGRREQAGA